MLISVTQKAAELFDQIIVLMEGEIVARGVHQDLLKRKSGYVQIYNSQQKYQQLYEYNRRVAKQQQKTSRPAGFAKKVLRLIRRA